MTNQTSDDKPERPKDTGSRWQKARLPILAPATSADQALADILIAGIEHLRGNEACVAARAHVEGVHQMRVAVRRLRSCLALYADYLPDDEARHLNGELRWLIGELGPARDWDVFVSDILAPVVAQLGAEPRIGELAARVEEQRDAAYGRAQAAITDRRYVGMMMLIAAWAEGRRWRDHLDAPQRAVLDRPCLQLAHLLIHRRHQEAVAVGDAFAALSEAERHKVRIRIKKLRYPIEFFQSLYPPRRVLPYLALLKELQDDLGAGNDVAVARSLLRQVTRALAGRDKARAAYAAGLVVGWHSHTANNLDARQVKVWQRFLARAPFWPLPKPLPAAPADAVTGDSAPGEAVAADAAAGEAGRHAQAGEGAAAAASADGRPAAAAERRSPLVH